MGRVKLRLLLLVVSFPIVLLIFLLLLVLFPLVRVILILILSSFSSLLPLSSYTQSLSVRVFDYIFVSFQQAKRRRSGLPSVLPV